MRRHSEAGLAAVLVVLLLPALLALLGVVLDGALLVHGQLQLETATAAAALAATDAYDRSLWQSERRVAIEPGGAARLAAAYLQRNMPGAAVEQVLVDPAAPNRITVRTSYRWPLAFMRLFGFDDQTLRAEGSAGKG